MIEHFLAKFGSAFSLARDLGSGPFFHSYLVTDKNSGARHYLSILSPAISPNASRAGPFLELLQEYSATGTGFLQIARGGFLPQESFYYLSNELSPNAVSVEEHVQNGPLSTHRIGQIGAACCNSLAALHASRRVHGALVPACIVVDDVGVYLMNAGITTALHQIEIGTRHFQFLETRYISPEQILTERATAQSDIYSLGAVLYHLLTGKPPYGGRTTAALMASVLIDENAADAPASGHEPGQVASAILRAIEKSPSDRWISAEQFSDALLQASPGSMSRLSTPDISRQQAGCLPCLAFLSVISGYLLHHLSSR